MTTPDLDPHLDDEIDDVVQAAETDPTERGSALLRNRRRVLGLGAAVVLMLVAIYAIFPKVVGLEGAFDRLDEAKWYWIVVALCMPVVIYGSGKAGLSAYLEGLDHRFHAQGLRVVCVKPGFVKTSMTAGLKPPPFAGEPAQVARQVLARLDRPRPVVYTPRMWALVMFVIRLLPRFVMRRISF